MGRKLHKDDDYTKGLNDGALGVLYSLKSDIENLIEKYEKKPVRCVLVECDGEGDSDESIEDGLEEFYGLQHGYGPDPLSAEDKKQMKELFNGNTD